MLRPSLPFCGPSRCCPAARNLCPDACWKFWESTTRQTNPVSLASERAFMRRAAECHATRRLGRLRTRVRLCLPQGDPGRHAAGRRPESGGSGTCAESKRSQGDDASGCLADAARQGGSGDPPGGARPHQSCSGGSCRIAPQRCGDLGSRKGAVSTSPGSTPLSLTHTLLAWAKDIWRMGSTPEGLDAMLPELRDTQLGAKRAWRANGRNAATPTAVTRPELFRRCAPCWFRYPKPRKGHACASCVAQCRWNGKW